MSIIDKNDISMGNGYYDENNIWQRIKYCFMYCGKDRCDCGPPNGEWRKESVQIDKLSRYTFGNSKAADILTEKLLRYNNQRYVQTVQSIISNYGELINHIDDIKDSRTKEIVAFMLIDRVNNNPTTLPNDIKSYMKNVIISRIKQRLIRDE